MKDKQIEQALEKIIKLYTQIEEDLLKEIASHFFIEDEFQNSDYWRVRKLEELGQFNQFTIEYLAKYNTQKQLAKPR
jgi:hypothetical protein